MIINFRSFDLAVVFHDRCRSLPLPGYLRDQLLRAASSAALNLSEGSERPSERDKLRFYFIALGSVRESQAVLRLAARCPAELHELADHLGASVWKLCHPKR